MRKSLGVGYVIDRNEVDIAAIERCPKDVPPDAPEAVDAYFDCHSSSSL